MIWLLDTKGRCVFGFASAAEALAHAAPDDIAAGLWQFFAADGGALLPAFDSPVTGEAQAPAPRLAPAPAGAARLQDIVHELRAVVLDGKRHGAAILREYLPPVVPG